MVKLALTKGCKKKKNPNTTKRFKVNGIIAKPKLDYLVPEKHFQFAFLFLQKV